MAGQDKRERDRSQTRDTADNTPNTGNLSAGDGAAPDDNWADEEIERASMGWQAEDFEMPTSVPEIDNLRADEEETDEVLDAAGGALTAMEAREMRRGQFRTPGDDLNPGIDHDENAPKQNQMPDKKAGGSRGKSDFR